LLVLSVAGTFDGRALVQFCHRHYGLQHECQIVPDYYLDLDTDDAREVAVLVLRSTLERLGDPGGSRLYPVSPGGS